MRKLNAVITLISGIFLLPQLNVAAQTPKTVGSIEVLDPAFEKYVDAKTKVEVLAGGFTWTEGPLWISDDSGGHLLFSDIPRNTIFRWSAARGVETFMTPSGYTGTSFYGLEPGSNGLALDPLGRLTMCEHGDRRLSVLTRGGGKRTLVDHFQGKRLNSPNDLVFDKAGNIYFTDPIYGLPERAEDPRRELDFCGVYRLSKNGQITLLTKEMSRPNGIGLSPDEKTLYVAQSDPAKPIWMSFPIKDDGSLDAGKVLYDATPHMSKPGANPSGLPDGLVVAKDGTIFGSGPSGVYVLQPDGKLIGRILANSPYRSGKVSNCSFDEAQKTLYMTSDDLVCRVKLK